MQAAEYPQRSCREAVYNDHSMAYSCELPDLHPGPCASQSVKASVSRRDAWEGNNPDWRDHIGSALDEV